MPDLLSFLSDLGASSLDAFWLPVLAWTVLAAVVEAALRASGASPRLSLNARGSLVALLPLSLFGPALLARWVPSVRPAPAPLTAAPPEMVALPSTPVQMPDAAIPPPDWATVALGSATVAAVLVGLAALGVLVGGLAWVARYRRRLGVAEGSVCDDAQAISRQMGIARRVSVAVVGEAISPFTVGLWRPLVALPTDLTPDARRLALAHELAHVRDAHFGWTVGERLVRAAFVWHPLVHLLGRGLALDREREADAAVLGLWPDRAAEYGRLLHALASRPSPRLALGASTSPLLSRLHTMSRPITARPRLARALGVLVIVLPLLASAAALPDASAPADLALSPTITAPTTAAAPQTLEEFVTGDPILEAVVETDSLTETVAATEPVRSDTLTRYLAQRQIWSDGNDMRLQLRLTSDATYEIAQAIADYYSAGDEPGELMVVGDGFQIRRSTLRKDAIPPPPTPARDVLRSFRADQEARPASASSESIFDGRTIIGGTLMTPDEVERYATVLSSELRSATQDLEALTGQVDFDSQTKRMSLEIRLREIQAQYRQVIEDQESRRLRDLRERVRGDG